MNMFEKLQESGITPSIAKKYNIVEVESIYKDINTGPDAKAIKIPYYDINGKSLDFARYRILKSNKGLFQPIGFKYYQVKGSNVEVFLPKSIKWNVVAKNIDEDIIITEGEFKSIALAEAGYNGIGLGGVSSYQSKKRGIPLISPLDKFEWKDRNVCIIYDSDLATNINVRSSQFKLARMLSDMGAIVTITFVQAPDGEKYGIDDAIVKYGPTIVQSLIDNAQAFTQYDAIEKLSDEFAYCISQEKIFSMASDTFMSVTAFHDLLANRFINVYKMNDEGDTKVVRVTLSKEWMKSPLRTTIQDICFEPSKDTGFLYKNGLLYYNIFKGFDVKPSMDKNIKNKKSVKLFLELIKFLCIDLKPEQLKWFISWLAVGLKNPGTKMHSAVIMWSHTEGNGKSTIGQLMRKLYAPYSGTVTSSMLNSSYNSFIQNRLFISSDELTGADVDNVKEVKTYMDILKNLITQDVVTINEKYMKPRDISDYCNYYFTSNNINMVAINNASRRFFVVHANEAVMPQEFYMQFYNECMSEKGLSEIMAYLQSYEVENSVIANAPAMVTKAKLEMIENSKTTFQQWLDDMMQCAKNVEAYESSGFPAGQIVPEIITLKDITEAASNALGRGQYMNSVKRMLVRNNIYILKDKIRTSKFSSGDTIVVLANKDKWRKASSLKILDYINNWRSYSYKGENS